MSRPFDLDARKGLLLVPSAVQGEVAQLGYFTRVSTHKELERSIAASIVPPADRGLKGLLRDPTAVNEYSQQLAKYDVRYEDATALHNAAKDYQPFLWLHFTAQHADSETRYRQLVLTDPLTLEDLWVGEIHLKNSWAWAPSAPNYWKPMIASLVEYIKANSQTFRR